MDLNDYDIQVGYLRGVGRKRYTETGDQGAAAFAMARVARMDNIHDTKLRQAVDDLFEEGYFVRPDHG